LDDNACGEGTAARLTPVLSRRGGDRATFSGRLRITGGTGRFARAKGKARYSGTSSLDLRQASFRQRGTITF
jgi:hypothetical protein